MKNYVVSTLLSVLVACPIRGQASAIIPGYARDSLAAADARSPTAQRDRKRALDSLAAGRHRWAAAHISEYELQVHANCFCVVFSGDSSRRLPLAIVRDGAIVAHDRGRPVDGIVKSTTIDSLFALLERDIRDPGRVVRQLELDRQYGFPRDYSAETPTIPDVWLDVHVDSFAVLREGSPPRTGPRPPKVR
jgi:hypothetical protein